ncbi:hypothetical protein ABEF95_000606 [Exophiala dermatitidis]
MSLIGEGAISKVYKLNSSIVVKRARIGVDEEADHATEQKVLQMLKKCCDQSYLIRCFYIRKNDTFLEYAVNGSVAALLDQNRHYDAQGNLSVSRYIDFSLVCHWMKQLSLAAKSLEEIGLAHGDICPRNLLLDSKWNLKLSDFDRTVRVGDDCLPIGAPFGRLLSDEDGGDTGTYGEAGVRTETFAIGSTYYTLLRGHEPYETEFCGDQHFVILQEKFQRKEFPLLDTSAADLVIRKCWYGEYRSVGELSLEFPAYGPEGSCEEHEEWLNLREMECKRFIEEGIVETLPR